MSVDKDFFEPERDFNYDFQSAGAPPTGWPESTHLPEALVPTHCSFCGVQCGMYLRVTDGQVTGVEPRDFPHNRGSLCPKGVVAYQQASHPDRWRRADAVVPLHRPPRDTSTLPDALKD